MRHKIWKLICYILPAGVIIEALLLWSYYFVFPRFNINCLMEITIAIGTIVAVIATCIKCKSFWSSMLRWLLLIGSCFLVMLFDAYTGIARFLLSTYNGEVGAGTRNAIGMQMLLTSVAVFGNTLIIVLVRAVFWGIRNAIQRR